MSIRKRCVPKQRSKSNHVATRLLPKMGQTENLQRNDDKDSGQKNHLMNGKWFSLRYIQLYNDGCCRGVVVGALNKPKPSQTISQTKTFHRNDWHFSAPPHQCVARRTTTEPNSIWHLTVSSSNL